MKFRVDRLRVAVESAIETQRQRHAEQIQALQDEYVQRVASHHERYGQAWLDAIPKIRAAVKAGKAVTIELLPTYGDRSHYSYVALLHAKKPRTDTFRPSADLIVVKNCLALLEDETVSDVQLARLGVRGTMLRTVFELAKTPITDVKA